MHKPTRQIEDGESQQGSQQDRPGPEAFAAMQYEAFQREKRRETDDTCQDVVDHPQRGGCEIDNQKCKDDSEKQQCFFHKRL